MIHMFHFHCKAALPPYFWRSLCFHVSIFSNYSDVCTPLSLLYSKKALPPYFDSRPGFHACILSWCVVSRVEILDHV